MSLEKPLTDQHSKLESRGQALQDLTGELKIRVPPKFAQDGHFWYLLGENYIEQFLLLTELANQGRIIIKDDKDLRYSSMRIALTHAQKSCEADKERVLDPLTKLWNRRYLDLHLEEMLKDLNKLTDDSDDRQQKVMGIIVVIMDADKFKVFNDTYGHPAGDKMLKQLAFALRSNTRPADGDLAGRYGGEEFCLIMPIIDPTDISTPPDKLWHPPTEAQVAMRIENLRRQVGGELHIEHQGKPLNITVSMGVAYITPNTGITNIETAYELADRQLYRAKNEGGRNCTYFPGGRVTLPPKI